MVWTATRSYRRVFAANIASYRLSTRNTSRILRKRFSGYFPYCRSIEAEFNQVFYCMHQSQLKREHVDLFKFLIDNPL
ncbi:hypothetical protein Y032_0462g1892 [Ancylostoma ceylanicum]|uniref:Uncharacterized protein n=1 Tax=Ancylostoma ceylanicum TaxID=53326 RepID=A0A016WZE6_9BILA|nr:hypothetical protein Y032_0462g1892 [Ancylostoma ceylanicum]